MKILFVFNNLNVKLGADLVSQMALNNEIAVVSLLESGPQKERLKSLGVRLIELNAKKSGPLEKILFLFSAPAIIKKLTKEIKSFKPDIVHTNLWLSDILGIIAAKKAAAPKIISTQHDAVKINPAARIAKTILLRNAVKIIAISRYTAKFVHTYFKVPEEKIVIVYNGAHLKKFRSCEKPDSEWQPIFGIIARLERIKGHAYYLEALKILKARGVKLPETIIVGDGKERQRFEQLASDIAPNLIQFVGTQNNITPYLKKLDVVVVPSLSEGLGVVIIEALAARKLVIASDVGGIPELLCNKKTGLLVTPANSMELAEAITWTLNHHDEAKAIRKLGHEWLMSKRECFDISEMAKKYLSIYSK